jgi:hypothetical protein
MVFSRSLGCLVAFVVGGCTQAHGGGTSSGGGSGTSGTASSSTGTGGTGGTGSGGSSSGGTSGAAGYAAVVLADQPAGYYRLDDASAGRMVDSSGHGFHGSYGPGVALRAPGLLATSSDLAASFPGGTWNADHYAHVPPHALLNPTAALSIEAWFRQPVVSGVDRPALVSYGETLGGVAYALVLDPNGRIDFELGLNGAATVLETEAVPQIGALYHVVATYDGTRKAIYLNGRLDSSAPAQGDIEAYPGPHGLGIGAADDGTRMVFLGTIDEVAIYGTALSAAQVAAHFRVGTGAPASPEHFDWVQIIGTGQSLSVGVAGYPIVSTVQPYGNLKLQDDGPDPKYPLDGGGLLSLVPLVELIRPPLADYTDGQYPGNIYGETPHSVMANQITALARAAGSDYLTIHSVVGWSGNPIDNINKQGIGTAYPGSLSEARTFQAMATAQGKRFGVGAIVLTHGESDSDNGNYETQVHQLVADYNADLKVITGQVTPIPLLLSQQSTFPGGAGTSRSTQAEWRLGLDYPGEVLCTGPKYQYPYSGDNVHMDSLNYGRLGEKYAEVFYQAVVQGRPWKPLQPSAAKLSGANITVSFDVPTMPLNWDPNLAPPHQTQFQAWALGKGFEVQDSTGPLTIQSATLSGATVVLALAQPPTGTGLTVSYAMNQDGTGYQGGTDLGRRGLLRDSDPFTGTPETLTCQVTQGSTVVASTTAGAFLLRTARDVVAGGFGGLPAETIVASKDSDDQLTLSQAWTGPSGTATLTFHHEQRNYCVQFQLEVQ